MNTLLDEKGASIPHTSCRALKKVLSAERLVGPKLFMLEQFQTHQQILFDLTANYLEPLPNVYQRLAYLFSLKAAPSGKYVHEGLAQVYGAEAVHQVIAQCHEEVFEKLLEMPLNVQGEELRSFLSTLPGTIEGNAALCQKTCENSIPSQAPSYLRELYCSNLGALLELLLDDRSRARPSS